MEFNNIQSLPGSPEPQDIFEPHMPGVDVLSEMDAFFAEIRRQIESGDGVEGLQSGQRCFAVITPGRMTMFLAAPLPNTIPPAKLDPVKQILPANQPLNISVISYTKLEALMKDESKLKCIPFLGYLAMFAYLGHNVIVFEGHSSALEAGVSDSDVLMIDSGMIPYLQENWADVVYKVMKPTARLFIHKRETYSLLPVAKKKSPPGWRYTEPDGEASYVNCLVTTLARGPMKSTRIISGQALPDLSELANDPEELEWISVMPFKYDQLNADQVIEIILGVTKSGLLSIFKPKRILQAKLVDSSGNLKDISFKLTVTKNVDGKRQLEIEQQ